MAVLVKCDSCGKQQSRAISPVGWLAVRIFTEDTEDDTDSVDLDACSTRCARQLLNLIESNGDTDAG